MSGMALSLTRGALGLLICGLSLWLANLVTAEPSRDARTATPKATDFTLVNVDPLPQSAPSNQYQAIVQRPLFHWTRRPLSARPIAPASPPEARALSPPVPAFVLRGAMLLQGKRTAILQREGGEIYVQLAEGEELEGWKMLKVEATRAALEFQGREFALELAPPPTTQK